MVARILGERQLLQTQLGTLACAASTIDTLVGIFLLAVVFSLSTRPGNTNQWLI